MEEPDGVNRNILSAAVSAATATHGVEVTVHFENHRIFGVYEESTKTILLKQMYREDEELHRFLNEFKMLKQTK